MFPNKANFPATESRDKQFFFPAVEDNFFFFTSVVVNVLHVDCCSLLRPKLSRVQRHGAACHGSQVTTARRGRSSEH